MRRVFLDTNVLIYAFSEDARRDRARELLREGGAISVQSLNEFANVARRKLGIDWTEVRDSLTVIASRCGPALPLTPELSREGLRLAERYCLSVYDGMSVAAALALECDAVLSEDMHAGLEIDGKLTVVNPFA